MIVGLTGYKQSGKDTAALPLIEQGWTRYALADPLRQVCCALFGWSAERVADKATIDPYWGISPRQALQRVGTELIRNHFHTVLPESENIWTRLLRKAYAECDYNMVVTDVRFPDEAETIHELGGVLIRVTRPGCAPDGHESESYIEHLPADYSIANDSTPQTLQNRLIMAAYLHAQNT